MNNPLLRQTVTATAALLEHRIATLTGAPAAPGGYGFAAYNAAAIGERVALTVEGVAEGVAASAIAIGDDLQIAAGSKVEKAAGGIVIGRAVTAAAADGDIVEFIVHPVQNGRHIVWVEATAATKYGQLTQLDGSRPAADEYAYPALAAAADDEMVPLCVSGPADVISSGNLAAGSLFAATAAGKIAAHAGNAVRIGRLLEASGADDNIARALIFPN